MLNKIILITEHYLYGILYAFAYIILYPGKHQKNKQMACASTEIYTVLIISGLTAWDTCPRFHCKSDSMETFTNKDFW